MYKILPRNEYNSEHIAYIEQHKTAINLLSNKINQIIGIKDINSTHVVCSNEYSKIVGLKCASDVAGRTDFDMPCEGTVQFAVDYVKEDKALIDSQKVKSTISILNVHDYCDGLKARVFKKKILFHEKTNCILGTLFTGHDVELKNFINIIPNYIIQFGAIGSMEVINQNYIEQSHLKLNDYEQEICFLFLLNWQPKQIAEFMNQFRPENISRTSDTIIKKRNYICNKLNLNYNTIDLCEYLVSIGFHNKMPKTFYSKIIGSKFISEEC